MAGCVAFVDPGRATMVVQAYISVLAAGAAVLVVERLASVLPPASVRPEPRGEAAAEDLIAAEFARLVRQVELGLAGGDDLRRFLSPVLRAIAWPLIRSHGIDPETEPEQANRLLGDEAWLLMTVDLVWPGTRTETLSAACSLSSAVDRLEALS